jgi:succinate-semialdehyde dehydrogenase/glutarate-semialdehyde dehydrogenase
VLQLNNPSLLQTGVFIDGQWLNTEIKTTVTNPFDDSLVAKVSLCDENLCCNAIDAAQKAFKKWREFPVKQRANLLYKWYELIIKNQDDLAMILTLEQGKPLAEARGEILYGASYVQWFAEQAKRIDGDIISPPNNDQRIACIKQPIGVVACITPWNFPNAMLARKIAPALAAGCTVVCKPSELTPLSALALAELSLQAGIPKGVINIVVGDAAMIGKQFCASKIVKKLSFTGSTAVGKLLSAQCVDTLKRVTMELGGNAPFIVFADADLDAAIEGLMASKYRNSGQTCVCTNRILLQKSIAKAFNQKLVEAVKNQLVVGSGTSTGVTTGPLINQQACNKVDELVNNALKQGAKLDYQDSTRNGNLYPPTVISKVTAHMPIAQQEIFGPVAITIEFEDEKEAIAIANDTDSGLAAYFYTQDYRRIYRVSEALEYGIVGVNSGIISNEMAPFGGVKQSGMGREGSKYGLDDYLEIKYICVGGINS